MGTGMAVFKARARALDMLGRQQIAGIPTAISELFKNAHDAYAGRVEVDFFRQTGLFLLRDDGLGMTLDDFESRWLTLGTESKLKEPGLKPPPSDPTKSPRPIMGEKGIGRLAIAAIGPQVLILTRAKRPEGLSDLVVAFIHWGFFEIPGVDLDRIHIPIRTFPGGLFPTNVDISHMLDEVQTNLKQLASFAGPERTATITTELKQFEIDPSRFDHFLLGPSLSTDGCGTHFYILPASENLVADLDVTDKNASSTEERASLMSKALLGFTNTMTPGHTPPVIKTSFRDHRFSEIYKDILESSEFFVPEDYINADHYINGSFDDYGRFIGTVSVYGTEFTEQVIAWPQGKAKPTDCGPFEIEMGYVPGNADSTLPKDDWVKVSAKLQRYGGLYIYRDNLRILPYGDVDFDWLEIEKRRSLQAARAFFSHRRMFGVVNITHERNGKLSEKAGREGFRDNKAYRQFRAIMINFLQQLAATFFTETGQHGDVFVARRSEINKLREAGKQRDQITRAARVAFEKRLERAFQNLEETDPRQQVEAIVIDATKAMEGLVLNNSVTNVNSQLSELETLAKRKIRELRELNRVNVPPGLGLTPELRRQLNTYSREIDRLDHETFQPALSRIEALFQEATHSGNIAVDQRGRLRNAIEIIATDARQGVRNEAQSVRRTLDDVSARVLTLLKRTEGELDRVITAALADADQFNLSNLKDSEIGEQRLALEENILAVAEQSRDALRTLATQFSNIQWIADTSVGIVQTTDMTAALEEEVLALRERTDTDLELVQLGMAIEVINHEFTNTVEAIRTALRRLKAWADANERLNVIYQDLRANFDHLDGYLTLFTPLHRRLHRSAIEFSGADIHTYLLDLFRTRLAKHEITIEATPAFLAFKIVGYPSTFYPVFVNLIDNAIYWLQDHQMPRTIHLDIEDDQIVVSDTGPGIRLRDRDSVFEQGFTRRPEGRGLGLFIARDVLSKVGYQLTLDPTEPHRGATFRIIPSTAKGDIA